MKERPDVVISGLSGRFPSADSLQEFRDNLFNSVDMVTADDTRWPQGLYNLPTRNGKIRTMDKFDNKFFEIPENEVNYMDPQERLLLELTFESIVDAGINPKVLQNSLTGYYVGACFQETNNDFDDPQACPSLPKNMLTRVSQYFQFKGPIVHIDTACGSSLSAFNEAVAAIKLGLCNQAIVAGSNTLFRPRVSVQFRDLKMVNKDGKCKCLDESGDGYVRSEAAVVIFLQKQPDSKRIYAKVLNSKSGSDGYKEEGITFPSVAGQQRLTEETYAEVGINPADIGYIEAHITGTTVGDPVEMNAIYNVICTKREQPLYIGCLKASIGHTEGASGLCGLAKACIVMQGQMIPPNIHYKKPNPNIMGLMNGKMLPVTKATPLPGDLIPVNCFGFGGANTHVLLQGQFEGKRNAGVKRRQSCSASIPLPRLINVCGRTSESVKHITSRLDSDQVQLMSPDFLAILNEYSKLDTMPYRGFSIAREHLQSDMIMFDNIEPQLVTNMPTYLVFDVDPNNNLETSSEFLKFPKFSQTMYALDKHFMKLGIYIMELFLKPNLDEMADDTLSYFATTVACHIAFIDLFRSIGFSPKGILGHSVGQLSCAYYEGIISKEEAVLCAYHAGMCNWDYERLRVELARILKKPRIQRVNKWRNAPSLVNDVFLAKEIVFPDLNKVDGLLKDAFVVDVGPSGIYVRGSKKLSEDLLINSLRTLGELYVNGASLKIEKLYEPVTYPLPSTTPSLSSLIKWDHSHTWPLKHYLFGDGHALMGGNFQSNKVLKYQIDRSIPEDAFFFDHRIDGYTLFPASGYLMLAWLSFSRIRNFPILESAIRFSEVSFKRATVLSKTSECSFTVLIDETTGNFTIKESDAVVVTGTIATTKMLNTQMCKEDTTETIVLSAKDIYKEFRVRGYDYGPYFQGVYDANASGLEGRLIWRDIVPDSVMQALAIETEEERATMWLRSWVSFVDAMFQLEILRDESDARSLFVPTKLDMLICHPEKMRKFVDQSTSISDALTLRDAKLVPAYTRYDKSTWTEGLVIQGLQTALLKRKQPFVRLHNYKLVPLTEQCALNHKDAQVYEKYYEACQDAVMGQLSSEYDLNDDQNALLRLLHERRPEMVTLDTDRWVGKCAEDECLQERFVKPFLDIMLFNHHLNEDMTTIDVSEVNSSNNILARHVTKYITDSLLESVLKVNYSLIHPSPDDLNDQAVTGTNQVIEGGHEKLPWLPTQALVVYWQDKKDDTLSVLQSAFTTLRENGFLMVFSRECLTDTKINIVLDVLGIKLPSTLQSDLKSSAQEAGFRYIGHKRLTNNHPLTCSFFRKVTVPVKLEMIKTIEVGLNDYDKWFEHIKELIREEDLKGDKRVYIFPQKDSQLITGVTGFVKSLRLEPGGNRIRCIIDNSVDHIDITDSKYQDVVKNDLVHNVFDSDKGWGSYEHVPLPQDITEDNSCQEKRMDITACYLRSLKPGDMTSLAWVQSSVPERTQNGYRKQLIDVHYSALNFRDIMFASGKLQSEAIPGVHPSVAQDSILGLEFAGLTSEPTPQRVMGIVPYKGLATRLIAEDDDFLWPVPESWTLEEAATVPVVYATAFYALIVRGNLTPMESVLIHSGCGGVGLAAINICLSKGCQVYTTVGSQEKRDFLLKNFPTLSSNHIFHSRSEKFEEDILKVTNGRGVDMVLNSLAEEKLQASVRCLAPHGRFLEIGKVDFIQNSGLQSWQMSENRSFHGVLLDSLFKYTKDEVNTQRTIHEKKMIKKLILDGIEQGVVRPLKRTVFSMESVEAAFRFMSSGKHIGKVLVSMKADGKNISVLKSSIFSPNKSYLVLGGLGGFGLELVNWLATKGATKIVAVSRRGVRDSFQKYAIRRLQKNGINIVLSTIDASSSEGAKELLAETAKLGPVGGIFNTAVVYKDSLFDDQSVNHFKEVTAPKSEATLHLDTWSRQLCPSLEYFVTFSSISCGRGNAGQTNYNFANSIMDSVCEARRSVGLHGLSMQWGVVGDVGIVSESSQSNDMILLGASSQRMPSLLQTLDRCLQSSYPIVLSYIKADAKSGSSATDTADVLSVVSRLLGLKDISIVDPTTTFGALGIDSLIAVEIKQVLERVVGNQLSTKEVRDFPVGKVIELSRSRA